MSHYPRKKKTTICKKNDTGPSVCNKNDDRLYILITDENINISTVNDNFLRKITTSFACS